MSMLKNTTFTYVYVIVLTTISMQFNNIGIEKTTDINRPLLSKYCCLENIFQLVDASSLILSEK